MALGETVHHICKLFIAPIDGSIKCSQAYVIRIDLRDRTHCGSQRHSEDAHQGLGILKFSTCLALKAV